MGPAIKHSKASWQLGKTTAIHGNLSLRKQGTALQIFLCHERVIEEVQ